MDLNPNTPLHWIDGDVLLRLGIAALLGLALGLDRELRGHAAGLRTHGIICFSAAVMTVSALALYRQIGGDESRMDPLRIFEATGAFVGIIAAGLIVFSKGEVHNLTTAAHICGRRHCVRGRAMAAGAGGGYRLGRHAHRAAPDRTPLDRSAPLA